jgi:uncharacterized protein YqgV (UPF0045/DUF77 family)
MDISIELTLSPLQDDYEPAIIDFIKKLRASGLKIKENSLSTHIYGEYEEVMAVLNSEIKSAFEGIDRGLIFMKIVKSDRSDYAADF